MKLKKSKRNGCVKPVNNTQNISGKINKNAHKLWDWAKVNAVYLGEIPNYRHNPAYRQM